LHSDYGSGDFARFYPGEFSWVLKAKGQGKGMAQEKSKGKKSWGLRSQEKNEGRRTLLLRARQGDLKAQAELMQKYGMRAYSDTERSEMPTYYDSGKKGSPPLTSNRTQSSTPNSTPSPGKIRAQAKKLTKTTAKPKGKT
jgi:hypothetical protein